MHTIWRRLFGIVVLSVVALVGLAACQSAEPAAAPTAAPTATPASAEAQSAAPPPAQSAGPGRPYSDPQLDRLGANGEVQFLNSFATW